MNRRKWDVNGAAVTPESALWTLYAGLCEGLRWRRHAATVAVDPARLAQRGAARPAGISTRAR
jgi:hypothetical protein